MILLKYIRSRNRKNILKAPTAKLRAKSAIEVKLDESQMILFTKRSPSMRKLLIIDEIFTKRKDGKMRCEGSDQVERVLPFGSRNQRE